MPDVSNIQVNADGQLFREVQMLPLRPAIYVMDHYDNDGAFIWRLLEDKDEWTE